MVIKKFYKTRPTCDVTFILPEGIPAHEVSVAGEFNDWNPERNRMRKAKGAWKTTVKLEQDHEYQYRFVVDGSEWHNDWEADKYVANEIDGDNSVVVTRAGEA